MKFKFCSKSQSGFTLIEMLIVVTIIGILASLILPRFINSSDVAKKNSHRTERQNVNHQIDIFYYNTATYPTAMTNAGWGSSYRDYFPDGVPASCNFGTGWSISDDTHRLALHSGHE